MSVTKVITTTISNIVINLISNDLEFIKGNLILSIKNKFHNNKTRKWIREFINQHDGTFLTTSTFERYLTYQKPIEKIHDYVFELDSDNLDKDTFISECVQECKEYFTANQESFIPTDERLLKDFYNKILNSFVKFSNEQLSITDKRVINENKRSSKQIIDKLDGGIGTLTEIKALLKDKQQITNPDILHSVFNYINKEIWKGEFESVFNLLPLIEGKSDDLENAIKIKLHLLSTYKCLHDDVIITFSSINDMYLHNDVARLLILHYFDDVDTLSKIKPNIRDNNLLTIIECLINKTTDKFFKVTEKLKNNANVHEIHFENHFENEKWLVNRICLLFLCQKVMINSNAIIAPLVKENKTFIDELILIQKETDSVILSFFNSEKCKQDRLSEIIDQLFHCQHKAEKYNDKAQLIYYDTLTKALASIDSDKLLYLHPNIPKSIQNNPKIEAINFYVKSLNNQIDESQLIDFCIKKEQYWVLNSYLAKTTDNNPNNLIDFIERHPSILKNHPAFFFNYYGAVKQIQGPDKAKELLNEYESQYSNHLEYWIELYAISKDNKSILISSIFEKWNNNEFSLLNLYTEIDFINILVSEQKYSQALEVVTKLETLGLSSSELLRIKAHILINLNRLLDAFQILLDIFEYYSNDTFVIGMILEIAIRYKRDVPQGIIDSALKTGNPNLLTHVAIVYEKENKLEEALQLATKSLILSKNEHDIIYSYYFGLSTRNPRNNSQQTNVTNDDTTLILQADGIQKIYCIHKNNILPEEQYTNHNAVHIHRDTAIQMGLFRQKVNSKIVIEEVEYVISEIMPLDFYLFRVCLNTLINNGSVKQFSVQTDSDDNNIIEELTTQLKEYVPSNESLNDWLTQYNDMSKLPFTLYALSKSTRLTYQEFIFVFLNDQSYYIRELVPPENDINDKFILSFSGLAILYKLGITIDILSKKDIVISASTIQEVIDANNKIIEENNKDNVSSMGIVNDRLYLHTSTEEEKQHFIQEATNFKKYVQQIRTEENTNDIAISAFKNSDLITLYGLCDYDCISIAKNNNRVLVHPETMVSYLSNCDEYKFSTIVVIDFLVELELSLNDLFEYMNKLVGFRFIITLTEKSFNYILNKYDETTDEDTKESILAKWIEYLSSTEEIEDDYKRHFSHNLTEVLRRVYKSASDIRHPIYRYLFMYHLKYNNLKLIFDKDKNGDLGVKLVNRDNNN